MLKLKTLGIKGKRKMLKAFRLIRGLGNVSSPAPVSYELENPLPNMHPPITNYLFETELKKAKALEHWRRWDRPK